MLLDLLPIGVHKDRQSVRVGRPFWASFVPAARRNGYQFGEHVLGALSGMHGTTLRALRDAGFLDMPPDYRALTVEEDVLLGLGAKAIGHQLLDINVNPGQPDVWIQFRPPVPIGGGELFSVGFAPCIRSKCPQRAGLCARKSAVRRARAAVPA